MSLNNAYESKLNRNFKPSAILTEIAKAKLSDTLHSTQDGVVYVTENADVSPFIYPVYDKAEGVVYVDARPFSAVNRDGSLSIKNTADEELSKYLALLEIVWAKSERVDTIYNAMSFSNEVFVKWLTGIIVHRFGLNPLQRSKVTALVAMFSLGRYYNSPGNEATQLKYMQQIKMKHPIDLDTVTEVFEKIDRTFPRDIEEFVAALQNIDLGPRLHGFNTTVLYSMMGGAWWINTNSTQIVAVALEYPPAFASLVHLAVSNNMYKRTTIGEVVYGMQQGDNFKQAIRALDLLVEQYT